MSPDFSGFKALALFQYLRPVETPQTLGSISTEFSFKRAWGARQEVSVGVLTVMTSEWAAG